MELQHGSFYFEKSSVEAEEIDTINSLPDDCLREIFRRLPIYQRLEIEKVCKRWKNIAETSWHDLKHLPFLRFSNGKMDSKTINEVQKNPNLIKKIVKRCGHFLKELKVATPCDPDVLSKAVNVCPNLNKLTIDVGNIECRTSRCNKKYFLRKFDLNLERFMKLNYLSLKRFSSESNLLKSIVANQKSLTHLSLFYCKIDSENLELITRLINLEALQVTHSIIDDNWLRKLIDNCRKIRHLDLSHSTFLTDSSALHLEELRNLESLSIQASRKITDRSLMNLYRLRELNCSHCERIQDPGVVKLIRNTNLTFLNVFNTRITTRTVTEAYVKWLTMGEKAKEIFRIAVCVSVQSSCRNFREAFLPLDRETTRYENISIFN
ncbi:F-box/LRR-repeat protein 7-like [Fopius arisanus]|uniref:F-box/LRR-repeat protein 7-like n=1 Tax=Fopius arisanus TaxID=64838 RepID=A0A0C9QJZ6_9HYME|nr:PREDICTED: F-box/LRR-repeat protein 7-like [Fopius arisanus]